MKDFLKFMLASMVGYLLISIILFLFFMILSFLFSFFLIPAKKNKPHSPKRMGLNLSLP